MRRWLCKYCGIYNGPEGRVQAYPDSLLGYWVLPKGYDEYPDSEFNEKDAHLYTPLWSVKSLLPGKTGTGVWPWRG